MKLTMTKLGDVLGRLCVGPAMLAIPLIAEAARTSSIVLTPDERAVCAVNQDSGSLSVWNEWHCQRLRGHLSH